MQSLHPMVQYLSGNIFSLYDSLWIFHAFCGFDFKSVQIKSNQRRGIDILQNTTQCELNFMTGYKI